MCRTPTPRTSTRTQPRTRTHTDTDTGVAANLFATGTVTLHPTYLLDVDAGLEVESADSDLWWELRDETTRDLVPEGFARIAPIGATPSGAGCAASALSFDPVDASSADLGPLAVGASICVHTGAGRYAGLTVSAHTPVDGTATPALTFDYVVWDAPEIPDPVLREPTAELAPWLDVRFGWQSDFADACEVAWFLPEETVALRVDGPLAPDLESSGVGAALRWDEDWGSTIRTVATCSRADTGRFAEHAFDLTRPVPAAPAPVITSFTGEAEATGSSYQPWAAHLVWTSTDADSCHLWWFNPDDGDHFNDQDGFPASADVLVEWRPDYERAGFDLVCTEAATGRSAVQSIVLSHP